MSSWLVDVQSWLQSSSVTKGKESRTKCDTRVQLAKHTSKHALAPKMNCFLGSFEDSDHLHTQPSAELFVVDQRRWDLNGQDYVLCIS